MSVRIVSALFTAKLKAFATTCGWIPVVASVFLWKPQRWDGTGDTPAARVVADSHLCSAVLRPQPAGRQQLPRPKWYHRQPPRPGNVTSRPSSKARGRQQRVPQFLEQGRGLSYHLCCGVLDLHALDNRRAVVGDDYIPSCGYNLQQCTTRV